VSLCERRLKAACFVSKTVAGCISTAGIARLQVASSCRYVIFCTVPMQPASSGASSSWITGRCVGTCQQQTRSHQNWLLEPLNSNSNCTPALQKATKLLPLLIINFPAPTAASATCRAVLCQWQALLHRGYAHSEPQASPGPVLPAVVRGSNNSSSSTML
jgi:hypothetical protein